MVIHGIDPSRVKAAVFDLGGVFLSGGVESVAVFGQRHGLTAEIWQLLRDELFSGDGLWASIERGERLLHDFLVHMQREIARRGVEISLDDARQFSRQLVRRPPSRLRVHSAGGSRRIPPVSDLPPRGLFSPRGRG